MTHTNRIWPQPRGRWWTLLRAPSLLDGAPGGRDDATVIEDDSRRLAGPRGW